MKNLRRLVFIFGFLAVPVCSQLTPGDQKSLQNEISHKGPGTTTHDHAASKTITQQDTKLSKGYDNESKIVNSKTRASKGNEQINYAKSNGNSNGSEKDIKQTTAQNTKGSAGKIQKSKKSNVRITGTTKGNVKATDQNYKHVTGQRLGLGEKSTASRNLNREYSKLAPNYHVHANGEVHYNHGTGQGQWQGHINSQQQMNRFGQSFNNVGLVGNRGGVMQRNWPSPSMLRTQADNFNRQNNDLHVQRVLMRNNRNVRRRPRIRSRNIRRGRVNANPRWVDRRFESANMNGFDRNIDIRPRRRMRARFRGYDVESNRRYHPKAARNAFNQHWCSYGISIREYWCGGGMNRQCPPGFVCMSNPFIMGSVGYCCGNVVYGFDVM